MQEERLKKLVDKIIKEGVPLFTRDSIEKMLRRMNTETEKDLKCCGNCGEYRSIAEKDFIAYSCLIHKDHIVPWKVCPKWIFDEADTERRMGIVAKGDN